MSYIDFVKADYSGKTDAEREAFIARDKKNLAGIIQERIARDVQNIVERWYEIDDIGYISVQEKFLELLKEAEQLYFFGFYTGTVAVAGIATEEYCKYLYQKHIGGADKLRQVDRINKLQSKNIIDQNLAKILHDVRNIRNDCMHYSVTFKSLSGEDLKTKAKEILKLYKEALSLISEAKIDDPLQEDKLIDISELTSSFSEFTLKHRNILRSNGIDLQMPPEIKNEVRQSLFWIGEIDIDSHLFKEMTLVDLPKTILLDRPLTPIIDLTLPQADNVRELKLQEGNIIIATVISSVSPSGQTETWNLLSIDEIFRGVLTIDEALNCIRQV